MSVQQDSMNYDRIAEAIDYIRQNFKEQPGLDEIARQASRSPFHFQRLFSDWAGTTPKKFLQYISIEHAKKLLKEQQSTLSKAPCLMPLLKRAYRAPGACTICLSASKG